MKAERRHELRTNSLAMALANIPDTVRTNIITVILTVLIAGLTVFVVRYRLSLSQERSVRAVDDLAVAREEIDEIKTMAGADASVGEEKFRDTTALLDSVMASLGSDPKVAARVLAARGDLNWNMAGLAGATTQPSSGESADDYLKAAATAWQQVVEKYSDQELPVCDARLGLAAVAEDHGDFDQARKHYQAIIDDSHAPQVIQIQARIMLQDLDKVAQPVVLAPGQATTSGPPATQPAH
ncbi:MAG TPA: hypothetical protein VL992_00190 [Tepidisphaeraceae bacterium]|nr:hypothetical protein [Tepidisphaeraceae bacterium]